MFDSERVLQELIHRNPDIVLNGIPELSPAYCGALAPGLIPLCREVPLSSGALDNLFIDANAILTLVECKRYGDDRLRREVYAQTINYASDLRNHLRDYSGKEFETEFANIIASGADVTVRGFPELIDGLKKDELLSGKDLRDWQSQFTPRLERNVKDGVFRIIILCGPTPDTNFSATKIRNLMQVMAFAESASARYDLLLMDVRDQNGHYESRILWRRYASLPQIPMIASSVRDTSAGIEAMRGRMSNLPPADRSSLEQLLKTLQDRGYYVVDNTYGFAIYDGRTDKSCYTKIQIEDAGWKIVRHQIRNGERLFRQIETNSIPSVVTNSTHELRTKRSSASETEGAMYEVVIEPNDTEHGDVLAVLEKLYRVDE